ncbi:MAG: terminase small subunit [bacterium]
MKLSQGVNGTTGMKANNTKQLTPKQKRFIDNYLISLNATDAAIKAEYSEKTARAIGCELLTKPNIQSEIEKRIKKIEDKTEITVEYVLNGLNTLAKTAKNEGVRLRAFELLGKHLTLFTDKLDTNWNVKRLSDEEINNLLPEAIEILKNTLKK